MVCGITLFSTPNSSWFACVLGAAAQVPLVLEQSLGPGVDTSPVDRTICTIMDGFGDIRGFALWLT